MAIQNNVQRNAELNHEKLYMGRSYKRNTQSEVRMQYRFSKFARVNRMVPLQTLRDMMLQASCVPRNTTDTR
jgi:hypothetical protein